MEARAEHTSDIDTTDREWKGGLGFRDTTTKASDPRQGACRWTSSGLETYAIQCNSCFRWRIIPSREKYEAIGEHTLEQPFVCAATQDWKRDMTCDAPADLDEDEPTLLWAVDKHNLPCPPKGFYRKVLLQSDNAKKFADVYYQAPCGKTLRSGVQVQKYLHEHPDLHAKISQFSFTSPKGKAEGLGMRVSSRMATVKDGTFSCPKPDKYMRGRIPNLELMGVKAPVHGQRPRPQPLPGTGTPAKSKKLSPSKSNALRHDKPNLEKSRGIESALHRAPMAVKRETSNIDRGTR